MKILGITTIKNTFYNITIGVKDLLNNKFGVKTFFNTDKDNITHLKIIEDVAEYVYKINPSYIVVINWKDTIYQQFVSAILYDLYKIRKYDLKYLINNIYSVTPYLLFVFQIEEKSIDKRYKLSDMIKTVAEELKTTSITETTAYLYVATKMVEVRRFGNGTPFQKKLAREANDFKNMFSLYKLVGNIEETISKLFPENNKVFKY